MELKYKYKVRLIVDESFSFGTLGAGGRGLTEHCGVMVRVSVCVHTCVGMGQGGSVSVPAEFKGT